MSDNLRISAESDDHFINSTRDEASAEIDSLLDEVEGQEAIEEPTTPPKEEPVETLESLDNEPQTTTEPVETETTQTTETTTTEPVETETTETTDDLDSLEEPRNLSESNSANWKKLRDKAKEYETKVKEYEAKVKEYEAKANQTQLPEDYEELKKFRQTFDLKNDPEFTSKYDQPITNAAESIYTVLKKNGAGDNVIEDIKKLGGPSSVAEEWWKETIAKLPMTDQERVKKALVDTVDLSEQREKEIQHAAENAEQILEGRKTKTVEWYRTETQQIAQHVEELTKGHEWARYRQAPANATAEQLEAIQQHNSRVQDLATKFNSALWPQTSKERAEVAAAAVYSHVLNDQLTRVDSARQALEARVKLLEKENSQLKGASRIPRGTAAPTGGKITPSTDDRIKMNASDAIDLGLDEALSENN
jgi:hypothetical protein